MGKEAQGFCREKLSSYGKGIDLLHRDQVVSSSIIVKILYQSLAIHVSLLNIKSFRPLFNNENQPFLFLNEGSAEPKSDRINA